MCWLAGIIQLLVLGAVLYLFYYFDQNWEFVARVSAKLGSSRWDQIFNYFFFNVVYYMIGFMAAGHSMIFSGKLMFLLAQKYLNFKPSSTREDIEEELRWQNKILNWKRPEEGGGKG